MDRYLIYCCVGTGGLFLSSVFAKILGYNVDGKIHKTGHAHDMGKGNWKGHDYICVVGDHWEINYRPDFPIYYAHGFTNDFMSNMPDIKIVYIHTDQRDFEKLTEIYVKKAWPYLWTPEEYEKWKGPDYPSYSVDNIHQCRLIQNDLINNLKFATIKKWYDNNPCLDTYYKINFKTIMGVDDQNLIDVVSGITKRSPTAELQDYVLEYQGLNQQLYFQNYQ